MEKRKPMATAAAILFLLLLLACLAGRFWASERAARSTGPTHIAAGGDRVVLVAGGSLYRLDAAGRLLDTIPLEAAGVDDDPIDLRILADGRLLIAAQRPARLWLCDPADWTCTALAFPGDRLPARQFKIVPGAAGGGFVYTDARGDTLWEVRGTGAPRRLLPRRTLSGPNDLAFDRQKHLWVADTDHRRVVELVPGADGRWTGGRELNTDNAYTRGRRHFPMMLAAGMDGNWWVTQASEFSDGFADLAVYDPDRGAVGIVDLPGGVFATDIVTLGDDLLVTDLESYRVYRVDARTRAIGVFGDAAFARAMAGLAQNRVRDERLSTLAMVGVVVIAVLMIAAAFFATPRERRWTPARAAVQLAPDEAPMPEVRGVHWLAREPRFERSMNWLDRSLIITVIAVLVASAGFFYWIQTPTAGLDAESKRSIYAEFGKILALIAVAVGALAFLLRGARRVLGIRLGTDGRTVYLRLPDGRQLTAQPSELAWTDRWLLFRAHRVPLQGNRGQRIYAPGELETWLAPLLRDARRLTDRELLKQTLFGSRHTPRTY